MSLREEIIHESLKLFSLKGFLSTGINDIIEAANTSKGGFYNHFASKEELFHVVLAEAQIIWRERTLYGLDEIHSPVGKIKKILENYRDRYLIDSDNFPGGCVFVTFSVELDDQRPHLSKEVNDGFEGVKRMIKRYLDDGKAIGELKSDLDTDMITQMIFAGMIGASVTYGIEKSTQSLDKVISSLIQFLDMARIPEQHP
jgi:AcrR family transcriptional regulator